MVKLCVGVSDVAHLRALQAARFAQTGQLLHRTRSFPKRAAEIRDGGSLFWVIAGAIVVRQRIPDIIEDATEDGRRCAAIMLDPELVAVAGRPTRPFQGWRYLAADAAPVDLGDLADDGSMPEGLRRELRKLGLL